MTENSNTINIVKLECSDCGKRVAFKAKKPIFSQYGKSWVYRIAFQAECPECTGDLDIDIVLCRSKESEHLSLADHSSGATLVEHSLRPIIPQ